MSRAFPLPGFELPSSSGCHFLLFSLSQRKNQLGATYLPILITVGEPTTKNGRKEKRLNRSDAGRLLLLPPYLSILSSCISRPPAPRPPIPIKQKYVSVSSSSFSRPSFLTFLNVLSPPYTPCWFFFRNFEEEKETATAGCSPKSEMGRRALASCPDRPADRLYSGRGGSEREENSVVFRCRRLLFPSPPRCFSHLADGWLPGWDGGGEASFYPPFPPKRLIENRLLSLHPVLSGVRIVFPTSVIGRRSGSDGLLLPISGAN